MKQQATTKISNINLNKELTRLLNWAAYLDKLLKERNSIEEEVNHIKEYKMRPIYFSTKAYEKRIYEIYSKERVHLKEQKESLTQQIQAAFPRDLYQELNSKKQGKKKDILLGWLFYELSLIFKRKHPQNKLEIPDWNHIIKLCKEDSNLKRTIESLSFGVGEFFYGPTIDDDKRRITQRACEWKTQNKIDKKLYPFKEAPPCTQRNNTLS